MFVEYEHGYVPARSMDPGLTHYIHLIMPVSITVIIKTAEMIKSSYLNLNSGLNLRAGKAAFKCQLYEKDKTAVNGRVTRYIWNVKFH